MKTLGVEVIEKNSIEELKAILKLLPTISAIVAPKILNKIDIQKDIEYILSDELNLNIPLIILGDNQTSSSKKTKQSYQYTSYVTQKSSWKDVIEAVSKILGMTVNWEDNRLSSNYISIPVSYFMNIDDKDLKCDVYIRVRRDGQNYQYIKRLHAGDTFLREDIIKYIDSGLKDFYVTRAHFTNFANHVTSTLVEKLKSDVVGKERVVLIAESFEVTKDRIHSLGIDEETVEVVEESIKSIKASLKEGGALTNFLMLLEANKLSYTSAHSYLSCLILHQIINSFEWNTVNIKDKLTYVAYFHDISLVEDDFAKINSEKAFKGYSFDSKKDKERVFNHAMLSAQIIDRFPKAPLGVSVFIKEHHGTKNGVGFSHGLNMAISPMSMMFIVVEAFVDEYFKIKRGPTLEEFENIFNELDKRFDKGTYSQTVTALKKMVNLTKASAA